MFGETGFFQTLQISFASMEVDLRPEAELLIQICAFICTSKVDRRAEELLSGQLDWPYILRTSEYHGIIPIVSRWISLTSPKKIPAEGKREITFSASANALH